MILAAVEDLLFSSKIRTVSKQVGAEVVFARSPQEILDKARSGGAQLTLVLFDLNSAKTDPLNTIAAIKADPDLSRVPVLGFASHVHVDLIRAARQAGADDVLPRSAFAANLPDILGR
jgi:two-component system chemotaxis sensor kinase CheA